MTFLPYMTFLPHMFMTLLPHMFFAAAHIYRTRQAVLIDLSSCDFSNYSFLA
jgi:hypothetical protein